MGSIGGFAKLTTTFRRWFYGPFWWMLPASGRSRLCPAVRPITTPDLKKTLEWEKVDIRPGTFFIRTGTLRYGAKPVATRKLSRARFGRINLEARQMGGETEGAILIGSDPQASKDGRHPRGAAVSSRSRVSASAAGRSHRRVSQSGELARDRVEFCYVASTNKIKGTVAGFAMRPIALRKQGRDVDVRMSRYECEVRRSKLRNSHLDIRHSHFDVRTSSLPRPFSTDFQKYPAFVPENLTSSNRSGRIRLQPACCQQPAKPKRVQISLYTIRCPQPPS